MPSLQILRLVPRELQMSQTKFSMAHAFAMTLLIPTIRYLYLDYHQYIALGPGGTPATVMGYLRVKFLGLFALSDPYEPPVIPMYMAQKKGHLSSLSTRQGPRPKTLGIAPHRQINQTSGPDVFALLAAAISNIANENSHLEEGTSCFEKHGTGLFSTYPLRRTCRGEVCHAHPSDGSLHLTLHPADAKVMLEAGRGERHPLSRGNWLERFVPGGFVMAYAPRNAEEVGIVLEIIQAAAWWVGGETVEVPSGLRRDSAIAEEMKDSDAYSEAKRNSIAENHTLLRLQEATASTIRL